MRLRARSRRVNILNSLPLRVSEIDATSLHDSAQLKTARALRLDNIATPDRSRQRGDRIKAFDFENQDGRIGVFDEAVCHIHLTVRAAGTHSRAGKGA